MKLYLILISIFINSIAHIDSYKIVDTFANRARQNNKNIYLNYLNDDDVEDTLYKAHDYKYLTPSSSASFYDDLQSKTDELEQLAKNLNDYDYVESLLNGKASLDSGELELNGNQHNNVDNNNVNNNKDDEEELEMHSSLIGGHQYVSGGAGEGKQHLQPDGAVDNKEEIKSDEDLPAYCDPPNPCPIGVISDDCDPRPFQEFSAEYSKTYQEQQNCMCDDDHNECHKSNKVKSQDKIVHFLNNLNVSFTSTSIIILNIHPFFR